MRLYCSRVKAVFIRYTLYVSYNGFESRHFACVGLNNKKYKKKFFVDDLEIRREIVVALWEIRLLNSHMNKQNKAENHSRIAIKKFNFETIEHVCFDSKLYFPFGLLDKITNNDFSLFSYYLFEKK